MQTASGKYTFAGSDIIIHIYFDLKVFEYISPPMTPPEEQRFFRLICDSLAAAVAKDHDEKHFYIKKAIKFSPTTLKLFCTDGFLIDTNLIIPISQQAFAEERVTISEVEQLPTRLQFSNEMMKNVNSRLPLFIEETQKALGRSLTPPVKETPAIEKPIATATPRMPDTTIDILVEVGNIKKEIKEIAKHDHRILKTLITEIDDTQNRLHDRVSKAGTLELEDNRQKLQEFAINLIATDKEHNISVIKKLLTKKMDEITSFPAKFDSTVHEISQRIREKTNTLFLFKQHVINALYESANQFHTSLTTKLQHSTPNNKKILIADFNKKFSPIAIIANDGSISSHEKALEKLMPLTLEELQNIISKEDKDNPGLLQKCNTSWTEESDELKIVIKNLSQLNKNLIAMFNDDLQFSNKNMTQITRVPFPRSFQFKFTQDALSYKKDVDDYCRKQKEAITDMAKEYKRAMQIDAIIDDTKHEITNIHQQTETLKEPLADYNNLLKLKEMSSALINKANQDQELATAYLSNARRLQEAINKSIDVNQLKSMARRVQLIINDIQVKTNDINNIMPLLNEHKKQLDLTINQYSQQFDTSTDTTELPEKMKLLNLDQKHIHTDYEAIQQLQEQLSLYEEAMKLNDKISSILTSNEMNSQKNEAKILLLQFIKNKESDTSENKKLKNDMIEAYSKLDMTITNKDKATLELDAIKSQLLSNLNHKPVITKQEMEETVKTSSDKINIIESVKKEAATCLAALKQLSTQFISHPK